MCHRFGPIHFGMVLDIEADSSACYMVYDSRPNCNCLIINYSAYFSKNPARKKR